MPSTPGQHLMPTLCASAPSRHPQAALLRRRRPSPPTIVRSGAALLRVHAVVADHRPAGCWRAKHRRAALPSSNSSETEAAVLGAAVPRQDYRQRRRCLLGSLARSQLASGRWWPAFATSRGGRYFIYRPPRARGSHRIRILRSGLSKRHPTPSREASAALQRRFAVLAAALRRSAASRAHAGLRMPFNLKLHLPNVAALCYVSSFFLLTAWTRPGYDSPRRRRLATSTAGAAAAAAAAQRCVSA